ncbi:MAG TPA: dienelactone hydrolase family protein [Longimicrobiaceae bacterium]|nr:dienelactone hydrolase family protein [Longimicrobiaceae bacterium]
MRPRPLLLLLALLAACGPVAHSASRADRAHVAAMAREHVGHTPVANASAAAPRQDVVAEEVVYGTAEGKELRGYLARPAGARGALPGIVVVHEWWGLNDNVRAMARRLAGEGYAALAVDMYGGEVADAPDEARALMLEVMEDRQSGARNLRAAAEYLKGRGARRLGVVGWCFGGGWAIQSALFMPELVDAAVVYYGQPVTDRAELARLDAPLLGLFGAEDRGIPVAQVRQMEAALRELGKDAEIVVYPGAAHAFANPSGQAYDARAAQDAWNRTTAFFAEHLRSP